MHLVQSFWKEVRVICACINTISLVPKLKKLQFFMFYIQSVTSTFKKPPWIVKLNSRKYYLKNKNQFLNHVIFIKMDGFERDLNEEDFSVLEILESKV